MKWHIILSFLILAIGSNYVFLQVKASESRNFCARLSSPTKSFTVMRAELKWGKWTPAPGSYHKEIESPLDKVFGPKQTIYICSAGRENLVSGTEAEVTIVQSDNVTNKFSLYWSNPNSGDPSHQLTYDKAKLDIDEQCPSTNYCEYTVIPKK